MKTWHVCWSLLMMMRIPSEAVQVIGGSRTVTQGENVDLLCKLIETDTDSVLSLIEWQKKPVKQSFFISPWDGPQPLNIFGDRVRFIGSIKDNIGSIRVSHVRLSDEGTYTCIFNVLPDGPYETEILLNVLVPPVMSATVAVHPVMGEREVVLATCTAAGAKPPAEVRWHTGALDASVRTVTNSTQHANGTTTVHSYLLGVPGRADNHQEVQCVVNQSALATETTLPYTIDIHYPPVSVNIITVSGTSVLRCVADANPEPNYIWSRVSQPWPGSAVREGNTLHFLSPSPELNGLYICDASNPYGRTSGSLYVHHLASGTYTSCGTCLIMLILLLFVLAIYWMVIRFAKYRVKRK